MTNAELDKDMIESIEMWLHEIEPKWVEKELNWLEELRSRLLEEEIPNDLEEAANEYAKLDEEGKWKDGGKYKGFIAGAKWDKEQMMKDAVEGVVMDFSSNQPRPQVDVYVDSNKYHTGDKVRIIVIPNTDEK